jgi:6-phosphogluconate dehydrogenase
MQLGFVGLGKMGGNMVRRILRDSDHTIVAFDFNAHALQGAKDAGATPATTIEEMVQKLEKPRMVWLMVPSGDPTQQTIDTLAGLLEEGDTIVDGGNSNWHDDVRRGGELDQKGIHYIDVGVSGGVWGLDNGYALMVGGTAESVAIAQPLFDALSPPKGFAHAGPVGAGHYTKMVHNGIEYGMMQAYAEGFEILEKSGFDLDLAAVADLWNQGSVIRSWLCELAADALKKDPHLDSIRGFVEDTGEGRWTLLESIDKSVPAPILALSLMMRFRSRQDESFSAKVVAALRNEFGGHAVKASKA